MAEQFVFPKLDEQTSYAVKAAVWRANTLLDLGIHEIGYLRLWGECSKHGTISEVYAEDEIMRLDCPDGMVRIPCTTCAVEGAPRLCPATMFATVKNPYI